MSQRTRLNAVETIVVAELLKTVLREVPGGGFKYLPEWSDGRVVNEVRDKIPHISGNMVWRVRTELFGLMPKPPKKEPKPAPAPSADTARLDAIETALAGLQTSLQAITNEFGKIRNEVVPRIEGELVGVKKNYVDLLSGRLDRLSKDVDILKLGRLGTVRNNGERRL